MARVPRPAVRVDVEHGVEVAQPAVDAPKADSAAPALVERGAAAPVRRQPDAVVGDRNADRAVAAALARDLDVGRPRMPAHVRRAAHERF